MPNVISTLTRPNGWNCNNPLKMKRFLILAALSAALVALSAPSSQAQTLERTGEFSSFDAINVTGPFEVNFIPSDKYTVKFVVEAVLADYVVFTQRENVIYVSYAEKDVPKEVKKIFKGRKNPDPTLQMTVYAPRLSEIVLYGTSVLNVDAEMTGDKLDVSLADKAKVAALRARAENVGINLKNKASVTMNLDVPGSLAIWTEGGSNARITGKFGSVSTVSAGSSTIAVEGESEEVAVKSDGTSQVSVKSKTGKVRIESGNSSKVSLEGSATDLEILGKNNAVTDVRKMEVDAVTLTLNSSTAHVGAKKKLVLELTGGAEVFYEGDPEMSIVKIVKSTLAPTGTK